jgi:hypothetical protein
VCVSWLKAVVRTDMFWTFCQECYIEEDMTSLTQVAKSIMKLQRMFGVIPDVKSKGVLSKVCPGVLCPCQSVALLSTLLLC